MEYKVTADSEAYISSQSHLIKKEVENLKQRTHFPMLEHRKMAMVFFPTF